MSIFSNNQILSYRLSSQRLAPRLSAQASSAGEVVKAAAGLQAQDLNAGILSVQPRSSGLTAAEVERARTQDRSFVWTWCMRGTLHLVDAEDLGWLAPLIGPVIIAGLRGRYRQLGLDEEIISKALRVIQEALSGQASLTRAEIARLWKARSLPSEGQAIPHLLQRAALEGVVCMGENRGAKPTYVLLREWTKPRPALPREDALAELARRYLQAYAPASPKDLAAWSGLGVTEAQQAFGLIEAELVQLKWEGDPVWMLAASQAEMDPPAEPGPVVRLLPRFDTYLLGYANRDQVVALQNAKRINAGGGILNPAILVDGRVLGTWKHQRRRGGIDIQVQPFETLPSNLMPLIEQEAQDIGRFLGTEARLLI